VTWREELRRVNVGGRQLIGASFRGVPFFVESSERSGGRRAVVHEFPLRDEPYVEDLGRRARSFRVDGYVVGDGYLAQRDALLSALEDAAGPGELVHPYHGVRRAVCVNLSVRETRQDGGMAIFALEFAETPAQAPAPTEDVDATGQVAASADAAVAATQAELAEKFDPKGMPAFALASAEAELRGAIDAVGAQLAPVVTVTQELAALTGQLRLLTSLASSLVRQPADVVAQFRSAITVLRVTADASPGAVMEALVDAYGAAFGVAAPETTLTRRRERANQLALSGALRRIMAIEAARLAPRVPYDATEAATAARDRVAAILDEQAQGAGDTAYPALVHLRSEVLRAVPGGAAFARVVGITRRVPVPSLLLAYQLYGSVDQEADVIARNNISHPGLVAGDLKVLSNAG
jgi:prophage DNA circulation protein